MDRNGVLEIVRGARDVATARGSSNIGRKTFSRQSNGRSRVRGQVGVAVRRDDNNGALLAYDSRHGNPVSDQDEEHGNEPAHAGEGTLGPRTTRTQQAGTQPPLDTAADYGTADLTRDSPEPTGGAHHSRVADAGSSSLDGGVCAQSLGSWLQPVPPPKAAAGKGSNRRRKRPLQETDSSELPRGSRAWATTSSQRRYHATPVTGRAGGDGNLAAWLEPRQPAASRERRSTSRRSGKFDGVVGRGSSGHSESGGGDDDDDGDGDDDGDDDDDDSGRWMSDRLDGLDPNGAARAKDSWTDRERRNLTCTDVALGAKRKSRRGGRRGWKTKAGGSKVFVAPGRGGGAVISSGQAAFRLFKSGGGDGRKKKRKR